ncbi:hypothetical protein [Streptomyces sp. NPDC092307]
MNARLVRRAVIGAVLLLAAVVVPAVYGTHAGITLGRIGLRIF